MQGGRALAALELKKNSSGIGGGLLFVRVRACAAVRPGGQRHPAGRASHGAAPPEFTLIYPLNGSPSAMAVQAGAWAGRRRSRI